MNILGMEGQDEEPLVQTASGLMLRPYIAWRYVQT